MRLYKMELYKLFHKKIFLVGVVSAILVMLLYFWFAEVGDELAVIDGKSYTGYEAIQVNREITEEYAGVITNQKIDQIVEKYGIPSILVDNLPGWRDGNYLNDFVARYFTDGSWEMGVIPTQRYSLEESELGEVCNKQNRVPILAYTKGWKVFVEMFNFGLMLGSILVICGISVVFADEGTTKMLPLLFTTEEGRRKDIWAKIAASFSLTFLIMIGITVFDFLLCNMVYGLDGFDNIAGIVLSDSFRMVHQQDFLNYLAILFIFGIQGMLFLCSITLCVSAWYNSSFTAVVVASVVWVIPVLLRMLFSGLFSIIIYATPIFLVMDGMINDIYSLWKIVVIISFVMGLVCMGVGYRTYKIKTA